MKTVITKVAAKYSALCQKAHAVASTAAYKHAFSIMLIAGIGLIAVGTTGLAMAQAGTGDMSRIEDAASIILVDLVEGPFGALIMIVAGLVAIIAAAMGAYRAAMAALVVAVGAFILRSFVSIFFPNVMLDAAP